MSENLKNLLDKLYKKYNKFKYIHPDPLEYVYRFDNPKDKEVAALLASSLAYGRVNQILKNLEEVFKIMDFSPYNYIRNSSSTQVFKDFEHFKYRFTKGSEIASIILGLQVIFTQYKSLESLYLKHFDPFDIPNSMNLFVKNILEASNISKSTMLPIPSKGSACKRLNLFFRWMIRKDEVDTGLWRKVSPSHLIIPLDTHMHKTSIVLGFTTSKTANFKTAMEITNRFKEISPSDPVKYDFALTRFGISPDFDQITFFKYLQEQTG